jgi:hypothetical protein
MIGDGLTQGTKVVGHALHPMTIIADAEVALLEDVKPGVKLQNRRLVIADELTVEREPRLTCGLCRFPNDLVEFKGEGAEDPCHHNVVQSSPIVRWISDVGEDMIVQGVGDEA